MPRAARWFFGIGFYSYALWNVYCAAAFGMLNGSGHRLPKGWFGYEDSPVGYVTMVAVSAVIVVWPALTWIILRALKRFERPLPAVPPMDSRTHTVSVDER